MLEYGPGYSDCMVRTSIDVVKPAFRSAQLVCGHNRIASRRWQNRATRLTLAGQ